LLSQISSMMASSLPIQSGRRDESSSKGGRDRTATRQIAWGSREGVMPQRPTLLHDVLGEAMVGDVNLFARQDYVEEA
jgi:hypothetical protein